MAFTWTEKMGPIALDPALEEATRAAIIAACTFVDGLPEGKVPVFAGGTFQVPMNDVATQLAAATMAGIKPNSGLAGQTILATAINCARSFAAAGSGDKGWAVLAEQIVKTRAIVMRSPRSVAG